MNRKIRKDELVWDDDKSRWGRVVLIDGKSGDGEAGNDLTITLRNNKGERWEVHSAFCYQIALGKTFQGDTVCIEHNEDIMGYPYYCPERTENLLERELD